MSCKFCLSIFYLKTDAPNINGLDSFFFFFFKKRNDIVIVLTQPGQNYFKTCFLFLGVMSHFFSDTDNKKTAFCSYLSSLNCFFFSF